MELNIVCMAMGDRYPNLYVHKLHSMLKRFVNRPYTLWCIVDRPRPLPDDIKIIDASKWTMRRPGMRITTNKIRLFDREALPFDEFLYLDVTLLIQKDMTPLLDYAFGREEDLVILKDWNYDCYNSCVMRIRQTDAMQTIFDTFESGKEYPRRNPGDQDFIHACVQDKGLQNRVALFPEEMIVSYRNARTINRTDPKAAHDLLEKGIIVKFFGRDKMHQVLNPLYRLFKIRLRKGGNGASDWKFWVEELRARWH